MSQPKQQPTWVRSSRCTNGTCVEVAKLDGQVLVRNSTRPDEVVSFTPAEWDAFIDGAQEVR